MALGSERRIGRYLAQGWSANAVVLYLLLISVFLFVENPGADVMVLIALVLWWLIGGLFGLVTAFVVWVFEYALDRRLNFWFRALIGILSPFGLAVSIGWLYGFLSEPLVILSVAMPFAILILPAALLSGSRVNPLGFVVMDLRREFPKKGWARTLSFIGVPLLRLSSAVGLLGAFLYLAGSRPPELGSWATTDTRFSGSIVAVLYFALTLVVSLCLPDKIIVVVAALVANTPVVFFLSSTQWQANSDVRFLAVIGWIFVSLWLLFFVSQLVRVETRRFIPVTMLEIRIRHALNCW